MKNEDLVFIIIFIISFLFRLNTAVKQGWLADEIFHVKDLGLWFVSNFWKYFFQLKHEIYPPVSPFFVNPPLAPILMALLIFIGNFFGFNSLISARLLNVILGSLNCVIVYFIGKKYFDKKIALLSSLSLLFAPVSIALDGSAYLDTLLISLFLIGLYYFLDFLNSKKNKSLIISSVSFSFGILTKFYIFPLIAPLIIILIVKTIKKDVPVSKVILFFFILFIIPPIIWSGARDWNHIKGVMLYILSLNQGEYPSQVNDYKGIKISSSNIPLYYFWMLFGKLTTITSLIFIFSLISFLYLRLIKKQRLYYENIFITIILFYILFIHYFGGLPSTVHRIYDLWPLVILFSSSIFIKTINQIVFNSNKFIWKLEEKKENYFYLIIFVIIVLNFVELVSWNPSMYNAYNNIIIGGVKGASKLYRVGDGEGLELLGKWLNENTDKNATVSGIRFWYLMKEYVDNREIIKQSLNEDIDESIANGAKYVFIHNSHKSGGITPTINFSKLDNVYNVYVQGYPYISLYKINTDNLYTKTDCIEFSANDIKASYKKGSNITITTLWNESVIDYNINNGYVFVQYPFILTGDGISFEIKSDNFINVIDVGLYETVCNVNGKTCGLGRVYYSIGKDWQKIYVPYDKLNIRFGNTTINSTDIFRLTISDKEYIKNRFYIKNICYYKKFNV